MEKALIVNSYLDLKTGKSRSLEELNRYLEKGWKVVKTSPMGVGGQVGGVYSLVIISDVGLAMNSSEYEMNQML